MKKVLFFCFYTFLIVVNVLAHSNQTEFDHYTTKNGLSNGYINSIMQDSEGFIWIGTSIGLNRFDGITFKSYNFNAKDSTSLPGTLINMVVEDSLRNLWVMTSNGLCVYNRKTDQFDRKIILVNGQKLSDYYFYACMIDSRGYLWISAANHEIMRFKIYDNPQVSTPVIEAEMYTLKEDDVDEVNKKNIYSFAEDKEGKVWTVSFSNQLFYLDRMKNAFIPKPINHPDVQKFSDKRKALLIDRDGDFYVTIEDNGLLEWKPKLDSFHLYKPDMAGRSPNGKVLSALAVDKDGLLWIGDRNAEGISIFNKNTGEFTYCRSELSNPYSLSTNKINCIYKDNVGAMWVGTIIGIDKFSPGKSKFNRYFSSANKENDLSTNNTLCFAEAKDGNIWIGTDGGGLNKLNQETGQFTWYSHNSQQSNSLSSNSIISMCVDHEQTLWMGTYHGGLAQMKENHFKAYLPNSADPYSIADRNIWYVLEDSRQNLWVATLSSGLDLFDRKSQRFYHYIHQATDSTSLCNNSIYGMYEDSKQNLYITTSSGVNVVDLKAYDFSKGRPDIKFRHLIHSDSANSLSTSNIYCMNEDLKGNLWFGTLGSGLDLLDVATGKFTNFSTNDGLPGNSITSILVDGSNNLWVATDKGLARFNPDSREVLVFDTHDGLQNLGFKSWAIKTKEGEMFFGGSDGFNSFYPERIILNQNQNKPPVLITGLKVFNTPVKINEHLNGHIHLNNSMSETKVLVLSHTENFFTFEFIALDYTTPEKNNYAYQMEGFDEDWVQCGTKREANYTNLDPGEYIFRVKASNNNGIWNEKGVSVKVIILPPWWATWWFRLIMVFAVIFLLASIYYTRVRHFKNQKVLLEKLVVKKTAELRQMNEILITQAQELNLTNQLLEERQGRIEQQSEELSVQQESLVKMNKELHDLNVTKDKFFSIIAHDIKNPFNAILGFASLLEENFDQWTDEMKLEIIKLIHLSSKNLYQLLENLLQWSRSQRGTIEFNPEKISSKEILNTVVQLLMGTAEAKNIDLKLIVPEGEIFVVADRQMLEAILRNIIGNALKFTHTEGKVQVMVKVQEGFALFSIADNGVGLSKELKENLFRIDVNNSSPGTQNEIGTGLGLILVKEFVERHNGQIGVDSIPGEGSTFYFTIPLSKS